MAQNIGLGAIRRLRDASSKSHLGRALRLATSTGCSFGRIFAWIFDCPDLRGSSVPLKPKTKMRRHALRMAATGLSWSSLIARALQRRRQRHGGGIWSRSSSQSRSADRISSRKFEPQRLSSKALASSLFSAPQGVREDVLLAIAVQLPAVREVHLHGLTD